MSLMTIILVSALFSSNGVKSSAADTLDYCCQLGRQNNSICGQFSVPIANISQEDQSLCISTMELCCLSAKREAACEKGQELAKNGLPCQPVQEDVPEACEYQQTLTECCLGCKVGSMLEGCRSMVNKLPSHYAQISFVKCCFEEDSSDDDDRCPPGFTFNQQLQVCDDIDECLEENVCDPDFDTCVNTLGDYTCEPKSDNLNDTCPHGFRFFLISCIDIDECAENMHNCSNSQVCVNLDGSFECQAWNPNGPILCPRGYQFNETIGQCVDVNECATSHPCEEGQQCLNTLGSYNCVRFIPCGTGYTFNALSERCEDDDECALGLDNCQGLGPAYFCRNTQGSFRCDRFECPQGEVMEETTGRCQPIICNAGYQLDPNGECTDVDECQHDVCPQDSVCQNSPGSFECRQQCPSGLKLHSDGVTCEDVDECTEPVCPQGQVCTNFIGGYRCDCPAGFRLNTSSGNCQDVDECSSAFTVCGMDTICQNTLGSYQCLCKPGFRRSESDRCVDINECNTIPDICQQRCANLWGSYRCHCRPGYRMSTDGRSCIDINECQEYQDICIGDCRNDPGSYKCTCPQGYILSSNERSCQDIDECEAPGGSPCTGEDQQCFNTRGGFKCVDVSCPSGYERDPRGKRCKLTPQGRTCLNPQDIQCLRRPVSLSFNFIALVSELRVPVSGPSQLGVDLFTMQSATYFTLTTKYTMEIKSVRAAKDVREEVDESFFRLKTPEPHRAIITLVKPIQGPQDIHIELRMDMYHIGRYQASALANLFIYVTPYRF